MFKFKWIPLAVFAVVGAMVALMVFGLLADSYRGTANTNGERIYFTATNDREQRISYTGGSAFGGMMMMGQLTCAYCHGVDGSGGQYFIHMQLLDAPDMRWAALSGPDTFRTIVVEGKHPNGEPMSSDMPRWNLDDEDLSDLADFITSMLDLEKGEYKMFPGQFMMGGWWMIIPIIGFLIMIFFMFLMMNRGGFWSNRHESRRDRSEIQDSGSAMDILKKRYAKGEITKEEFDQIKEDL